MLVIFIIALILKKNIKLIQKKIILTKKNKFLTKINILPIIRRDLKGII